MASFDRAARVSSQNFFDRAVRVLSQYFDRIAQLGVIAMVLVAVANMLLRAVWHPIFGTFDIVSFIGATVVSFSIAYCAVKKGHIQVDLAMEHLPRRVQAIIDSITSIFSLGIFAVLSWQSVAYGNDVWRTGEVSMTALAPFYPYIYGMALGCVLLCLVILANFIKSISEVISK